jgi:hypothetical protein
MEDDASQQEADPPHGFEESRNNTALIALIPMGRALPSVLRLIFPTIPPSAVAGPAFVLPPTLEFGP